MGGVRGLLEATKAGLIAQPSLCEERCVGLGGSVEGGWGWGLFVSSLCVQEVSHLVHVWEWVEGVGMGGSAVSKLLVFCLLTPLPISEKVSFHASFHGMGLWN